MKFDSMDPLTWFDDLLPDGVEWREVDAETGEQHLFGFGRNLTQDYWDSWN